MNTNVLIDGVECYSTSRAGGTGEGQYSVLFQRDKASLEQIENIHWAKPEITVPAHSYCALPDGYGFQVVNITYSHSSQRWMVVLKVLRQYLGDVTGYQAQIETLNSEKEALSADLNQKIETLNRENCTLQSEKDTLSAQLAESDALVMELYEASLTSATPDEDHAEQEAVV